MGAVASWPSGPRPLTSAGLWPYIGTNEMNTSPMPDLTPILELFHQLPYGTGKFALMLGLVIGVTILFTIKAPGGVKPEAWMSWDD